MNAGFALVCVAALVVVYASPIDKSRHGVRSVKEHKFNKARMEGVLNRANRGRGPGKIAEVAEPAKRGRHVKLAEADLKKSEAHLDKIAKSVPEGRVTTKLAAKHEMQENRVKNQNRVKHQRHENRVQHQNSVEHHRQETVITSCPTRGLQLVDAPVTINIQGYENNQNCEWLVAVPEGRFVNVGFPRLSIEYHSSCGWDSLSIHDSDQHGFPLAVLCGYEAPAAVQSITNHVFIRFNSDYSVTAGGFEMVITATDTPGAVSDAMLACPGPLELTGTELIIQSPGYDVQQPYTNNLQCQWTVSVTPGMFAQLEFEFLQVEASSGCWFDEVLVLDGLDHDHAAHHAHDAPVLGSFCGSDIPPAITGSTNSLEIIFYTDYSVTGRGFSIRVTETDTPAPEPEVHPGCPGPANLSADGSELVSVNFGSGNYNDYETCAWSVAAESGQYVTLTFTDFDVEYHGSCSYDRLTIHEGSDDSAPSVTYCGSDLPPPFTSSGDRVFVTFTSDYSVTRSGFRIVATQSATPGEILPDNPILSSPGPHHIALTEGGEPASIYSPLYFTSGYRNYEFSSWLITAPEGRFIGVHFVSLAVESAPNCWYDAVRLLDGPNSLHILRLEACGHEAPADFVTQTNTALIEFTSDSSVTDQGFHIEFTVETEPGTLPEDFDAGVWDEDSWYGSYYSYNPTYSYGPTYSSYHGSSDSYPSSDWYPSSWEFSSWPSSSWGFSSWPYSSWDFSYSSYSSWDFSSWPFSSWLFGSEGFPSSWLLSSWESSQYSSLSPSWSDGSDWSDWSS